jgi:DNA-directed RNA polymerase omega subunit
MARAGHMSVDLSDVNQDELMKRAGGRYRLVSLVERRMRELQRGLPPLVERRSTLLETAIEEFRSGKIWLAVGDEAAALQEARGAAAGATPAPDSGASTGGE